MYEEGPDETRQWAWTFLSLGAMSVCPIACLIDGRIPPSEETEAEAWEKERLVFDR